MSQYEETLCEPRIRYEWYMTSSLGARYILYPVRNKHSEKDVGRSMSWLNRNMDVVSIQVRWVNEEAKDEDQPARIPDHVIISKLREELGAKEAYIQELEEKLQKQEVSLNREEKRAIRRDQTYKNLHRQLEAAHKEIARLRKNISEYAARLHNQQSS